MAPAALVLLRSSLGTCLGNSDRGAVSLLLPLRSLRCGLLLHGLGLLRSIPASFVGLIVVLRLGCSCVSKQAQRQLAASPQVWNHQGIPQAVGKTGGGGL